MSLGRAVAWQFFRGNVGQEISSRERKMPSGVPPGARDLPWLEVDRHTQLQPMSGLPQLRAWGPMLAVSVTWELANTGALVLPKDSWLMVPGASKASV